MAACQYYPVSRPTHTAFWLKIETISVEHDYGHRCGEYSPGVTTGRGAVLCEWEFIMSQNKASTAQNMIPSPLLYIYICPSKYRCKLLARCMLFCWCTLLAHASLARPARTSPNSGSHTPEVRTYAKPPCAHPPQGPPLPPPTCWADLWS